MPEGKEDFKSRVAGYQVRERIFGLFCITVIAIVAMFRLSDPENIIINIIIAIGAYATGRAEQQRQGDRQPPAK